MDALNDMASGAAGIVTALGMGTVFVCLTLLYVMTHLLGAVMSMATSRAARAASAGSDVEVGTSNESSEPDSSVEQASAIAAAVTLALSRHRAARSRPIESPSGIDPWKIAGRIGMLR